MLIEDCGFFCTAGPAVKGYVEDTKLLLQQSGERFVISYASLSLFYQLLITPN